SLEAKTSPSYTRDSIQKFIRNYSTMQNKGLACMFVAESMNKNLNEAFYHFIVFRLSDNEILIHERMRGEPIGIGIRNYWGGALYNIMEDLKKNYYKKWKTKYGK